MIIVWMLLCSKSTKTPVSSENDCVLVLHGTFCLFNYSNCNPILFIHKWTPHSAQSTSPVQTSYEKNKLVTSRAYWEISHQCECWDLVERNQNFIWGKILFPLLHFSRSSVHWIALCASKISSACMFFWAVPQKVEFPWCIILFSYVVDEYGNA